VRLSLWPTLRQPWSDVLDAARHADATGWDRVYVADHFMGDGANDPTDVPTLESTAVLAALATATVGIGLGTLVLGNTYRHPAVVANWIATVDHLSGGRAVLGLGAGWQANEHEQYGIELPSPGDRRRRFAEACEVIRGLLDRPSVSFEGATYVLRDAISEPKPIGRVPLLLGGRRERMLGVVARWADEWNIWADAAQLRDRDAVLRAQCEKVGRDPSTIVRSANALVLVTDDADAARAFAGPTGRPAVAGGRSALTDFLGPLLDAGLDEFVVPDNHLGRGGARHEAMGVLADAAGSFGWSPRV
jgi:alkanesulfonate monooxygenase SsuD/methylene tetrahydromethanopterin reductase-like flavin-dependent oxidoreductase (luciferase family)